MRRPRWRAVLLLGGLAAAALGLDRLTTLWPAPTLHPDVRAALERSLDDQKELATLAPEREDERRARFEEVRKLLQRVRVLEHNRDAVVRRYRLLLVTLLGLLAGTVLVAARARRRQLDRRLEALRAALAELARGSAAVRVEGERRRDTVGRIAGMIEQASERVARDHRRLASLENLGAWQEAARRHAHEMRTPLTGARLELERLQREAAEADGSATPGLPDRIESVLEELDRLGTFVEGFTSFARLPAPRLRRLDPTALLRRVATTYAEAWPTLELVGPGDDAPPLAADADPEMIREALVNLAENAARAGARRLEIGIAAEPDAIVVDVRDDGPGLPPEVRARLFEPYTTTRPIGEGMGLGLAISRKILLDHGGELQLLESGPAGTTFRLTLPHLAGGAAGESPDPGADPGSPESIAGARPRRSAPVAPEAAPASPPAVARPTRPSSLPPRRSVP